MTPVAFAYMCISFWWIFILRSTQQKKLRIQHNLNLKMKVERKLVKWITEKKGTAETSCWVTPSNLCPSTLNCIFYFFYFFQRSIENSFGRADFFGNVFMSVTNLYPRSFSRTLFCRSWIIFSEEINVRDALERDKLYVFRNYWKDLLCTRN